MKKSPSPSLLTLTLTDALRGLTNKQFDIADVYRSLEEAVRAKNPSLNIYLARLKDGLSIAEEQQGKPFMGLPLAVKDNFLTKGLETTASSMMLKGFMPVYESTVTARLGSAGAVVYGKTNMDAWAHGSSTETSDFGPTKNPRNPEYLPGGSSGGSTAAVAADLCYAAIGSETAGSIRQPAAWCGVVGVKPTYGRVSRAGVVAMGSSLDCPGPIGKTVEDSALLLTHMAGRDRYDATTADMPVPDYTKALTTSMKGLRVGIMYMDHPDIKGTVVDVAVHDAGKVFERMGANVEEITISEMLKVGKALTPDHAVGVYTVVQRGEVSSNLARYDGIRYGHDRTKFGDEAKRRIMLGTFTLSKGYSERYYQQAQQVRTLYRKNFNDLFSRFDILLSSPSPGYALPLGALGENPMFGELQDILVEPSSLAGLPGVSVPCHRDDSTGLYLGLNIMTNLWQEELMLAAAHQYEQATSWNPWRKST